MHLINHMIHRYAYRVSRRFRDRNYLLVRGGRWGTDFDCIEQVTHLDPQKEFLASPLVYIRKRNDKLLGKTLGCASPCKAA